MKVAEGISRMICAGCLLASTAWAQSRPSAPITLTVTTTSHGYEIPIDFSGLSFERGTLNTNNAGASGYLFSTTNTQLTTLFQNLGIHSLRVGGGSVDTMVPVGYNPDGNRGIDSLFDFAQAAGAKVIYTVRMLNTKNTLPNLKADDAVIDQYIWNNYRANVSNFAIGNEPDFRNPYHTAGDPAIFETTPGATATAYPSYLVDWRNFASTILGSAPGATFSGPDTGAYNDTTDESWTQRFADDEKNSGIIADVTQHYYVGASPGTTTAQQAIDNMLSTAWVNDTAIGTQPTGAGNGKTTSYTPYPWLYSNNMAPVVADGLPYRLTESDDYLTGVSGASNGFASALWTLDYMHWWAAHNAAGVNFHNKQWIYTDTIVPDPNPCVTTCGNYQTTPKGYGIKAFDLGGHGYAEPVTISNPDGINVTAYAVGDAQDLYVTIVNKTHSSTNDSTDASVTIAPSGFKAASCAAMVLTDGDPGNASSYNAVLGGATIANNARWLGTWAPLAPETSGDCTVTVPSTSAAVVKIHAASNYVGPIQIDQNGALEIFGTRMDGDKRHQSQNDDIRSGSRDGGDTWHDWQNATDVPNSSLANWNGWTDLGGGVLSTGGTAVVKNLNNTLEIFVPSTTGDVYHNYQLMPDGVWSGWIDMGSSSNGITDLQASNNADGSLSVFGIGTNGEVWYASQSAPGVGWSNWSDLSGENIEPGFVVGQNLNGTLEVFGVDSRSNVWHNWQTASGAWSGWNYLSGEMVNPRLAIARNLDGRLEIFGVDRNFSVWHNWQTAPDGSWNGWSEIPGRQLQPGFVVGQNKDGRLTLFGVGARNHDAWNDWDDFGPNKNERGVWSIEQQTPGGNFGTNWTDMGGNNMDSKLVVGNTADGRMQLFGIGYNNDVWSSWQSTTGSGWVGWADFGGRGTTFYPGHP